MEDSPPDYPPPPPPLVPQEHAAQLFFPALPLRSGLFQNAAQLFFSREMQKWQKVFCQKACMSVAGLTLLTPSLSTPRSGGQAASSSQPRLLPRLRQMGQLGTPGDENLWCCS